MADARLEVLRRFGKRVRAKRDELGISQEELADRADLDRTYVGGVERGERNVSLINIHRLARALGLAPRDLL
jgi:transcriptional regulator with XRE-family HTH domain